MQAIAGRSGAKFLALGLAIVFLLACTSYVTHLDKAAGDDGKGHCSICLGATAHVVQPAAVLAVAPRLVAAGIAPSSGPLLKQDRFVSSHYIRPPPSC